MKGRDKQMKNTRLNNVIFPIWIIFLLPQVLLIVLPANFLIDSLVIILGFKALRVTDWFKRYKESILKVWGIGFLADLIGALLLFATQLFGLNDYLYNNLVQPVMWNPFESPLAVIYIVIAIVVSGYLIYLLNYHLVFKKTDLPEKQKRRMARLLALATAPYLFLLPTALLY